MPVSTYWWFPPHSYPSSLWPSWGHWGWHRRCSRGQTCASSPRFSWGGSRSGPCWAAGGHGRGSAPPASWGSPACRSHRLSAPRIPTETDTRLNYSRLYYLQKSSRYRNRLQGTTGQHVHVPHKSLLLPVPATLTNTFGTGQQFYSTNRKK